MYQIPDWDEFQQYKDRRPTWIKFHRSLLDNRAFQKLPVSPRAMLPMMWLLASEHKDASSGMIDLTAEDISYRLRMPESEVNKNLEILVTNGFLIDVQNRTEPYRTVPREETEERKEEESDFDSFYAAFPKKVAPDDAKKSYSKALKKTSHQTIMQGVAKYKASVAGTEKRFIQAPAAWLNKGRWADEHADDSQSNVPDWIKAQR